MALTINQLSPIYSTSAQISSTDMEEIAELGFKTIINNRPDYEGGKTQPLSSELEAAAHKHGLQYVYIPVIPNQVNASNIKACKGALKTNATPVLAFCRTGNRAANLFELVNQ